MLTSCILRYFLAFGIGYDSLFELSYIVLYTVGEVSDGDGHHIRCSGYGPLDCNEMLG